MKTRIIYLCLLVIFSTTGCISKNARKGINGNKNIVTRTIQVDDFEEIRDWAALHHEKLNGKGYPFGKTADELKASIRSTRRTVRYVITSKQMAPPRWRSAWTRICLTYWI